MFLDLDVKQTEGVETTLHVALDLVVEAVGPPRVLEEGDRDGLPKTIQLEAATRDRVHDRSVVDDLEADPPLLCAQHQVRVGCCTVSCRWSVFPGTEKEQKDSRDRKRSKEPKDIANNKEGDLVIDGLVEDRFDTLLDHVTVRLGDRFAVILLEP